MHPPRASRPANPQASKATAAQSRVKMIEKLKAEQVEAPSAASSDGGGDAKKVGARWMLLGVLPVLALLGLH